eukprot:1963653-Lingulodinium_polyedra.AAC.1
MRPALNGLAAFPCILRVLLAPRVFQALSACQYVQVLASVSSGSGDSIVSTRLVCAQWFQCPGL